MATIGYVRVSSISQNTQRQDFEGFEIDKIFEDKASAKDANRPALQEMLNYVREGDTVFVHSIDRLARSLPDLHKIVNFLQSKKVGIKFIKENLFFEAGKESDPMSGLLFNILGAFAEFERQLIKERQKEGIAKAKAAGKYKGRAKSLNNEEVLRVRELKEMGVSISKIARNFKVSRNTIYKCL